MAEVATGVRERLALLDEYQTLAPEYLELVESEEKARDARIIVESRLREIAEQIGRDPAGVLPKRRRTRAELDAAKNGPAKPKPKPKKAPAEVADEFPTE